MKFTKQTYRVAKRRAMSDAFELFWYSNTPVSVAFRLPIKIEARRKRESGKGEI